MRHAAKVVQEIKALRSSVQQREKEKAERATLVQQEKLVRGKVRRCGRWRWAGVWAGCMAAGGVHPAPCQRGAMGLQLKLPACQVVLLLNCCFTCWAVESAADCIAAGGAHDTAASRCWATCQSSLGPITAWHAHSLRWCAIPALVQGRVYALPDVWIRPAFGGKGRKVTGTLEAHSNGFRYSSPKGEELDIMYRWVPARRMALGCRGLDGVTCIVWAAGSVACAR